MRIMVTDKLSKILARYENTGHVNMIFDTGQTVASRYQLNCRGSGVESHQNLGQDLLPEKTLPAKATWLSVTLNNINSCSEV